MDHIGIDVHKKESQICILAEGGELLERRIRTEPRRLAEELGARAPARILLESATESEWVARCLEELGHEVIVADPNFAPMYATRTRKVKTDRRDARGIAVVALARRLAGILFALLRDGTVYEQTRRQPYDVQAAVLA
jgi:transposase